MYPIIFNLAQKTTIDLQFGNKSEIPSAMF